MDIIEVILLIAGSLIFLLSFLIPEKKGVLSGGLAENEIKNLVSQELESVRNHVDDVVEEAVSYSMEKTERSLERLSNEKIMAVNEYSDTVLSEIHKNHEEAVFLYDMLNKKHTSLKNIMAQINDTIKNAGETIAALENVMAQRRDEAGVSGEEMAAAPPAWEPASWKQDTARETEPEEPMGEPEESVESQEAYDEERQNNKDRILERYRQGKTAVIIAKELGLGIGEVRLVIDLYRNQ